MRRSPAARPARGRAARGLQYFISQKVLKLFQSQGEWVHDGKPYDFRCRVFWVMRKSRMLVMEKQAVLSGEGTTVRSDWFSLHFDGDFSRLQKAEAIGNSSFRRTAVVDGREQGWDISGSLIQMHYDAQGRLHLPRQRIHGAGDARIGRAVIFGHVQDVGHAAGASCVVGSPEAASSARANQTCGVTMG